MSARPVAIVTGMIATYPVGGVLWDYGQYALGLERLGYDVFYLEDTGGETYDPRAGLYGPDCGPGVAFLAESLAALSPALGRRWHFRALSGEVHGTTHDELSAALARAHLFLNVSGGTLLRDEYMRVPHKVLIDSDPGWNHFVNYPKWDASPGWQGTSGYRAHDHFFTYAERIGQAGCVLPDLGLDWRPTRPPVVVDQGRRQGAGESWTTVMTWDNFRRPVEHGGRRYGTKELEFPKIERVPQRLPDARFELAVGGSGAPLARFRELGWGVVDSHSVSTTPDAYRAYIERSRGELSVAKNLYTATGSGWFSCRSVCYLAAGRPVVLQDTGYSAVVPTGAGLHAFTTEDEAVAALEAVERDHARESAAAVEVAREHFGHDRVLGALLAEVGLA
jgi:hypothetical protein